MTDAETNRIIAEAMGWTDIFPCPIREWGLRGTRNKDECEFGMQIPDYLHDANAALEATVELVPVDWRLEYDVLNRRWFARIGNYEETDHMEQKVWSANTPAPPLCAMILAVLAEREEVKT